MSDDDKIILTAEEAISLLPDNDEELHSFMQAGPVLLGCDDSRASMIAQINAAPCLEIGGPACKAMNHALVVHGKENGHLFFATDPARVEAMEAAKVAAS